MAALSVDGLNVQGFLISKAVTAPFTLLANLVGSDEDMQRVSFSSGSSELNEATKAKLTDLVQAPHQRPDLSLVLHGRLHPTADREQLQKALLREQLLASGLSEEDVRSKSDAWTKASEARYVGLEPMGAPADGESVPSVLHIATPPVQAAADQTANLEAVLSNGR
ncbi:MAG: hypothetical protein ACI8QT_001859 [Halioglobus sp.]